MRKSLFAILLLPILALAAQSPFEGTWNFTPFEFGSEVLLLQDGIFQDAIAEQPIKVKADGTDQPNPPDSKTDTVAVKVVDDKTVEVTIKRNGKVIEQDIHTASADGKTIIKDQRLTPEAGSGKQPETIKWPLSCVAAGPAGSHAISGREIGVREIGEIGVRLEFPQISMPLCGFGTMFFGKKGNSSLTPILEGHRHFRSRG